MKPLKKEIKRTLQLKKLAEEKEKAIKKLKKLNEEEPLEIMEDEEDNNEERDTELEDFLKNYQEAGSKISVARWDDEEDTWAKIGVYPLKDFETSTEKIAQKYGGGTYQFTIRDSKGQYVKSFTQTFDKVAYPDRTEHTYISTQPEFNPMELIREMREQNKEQQNQFSIMLTSFMKTMAEVMAQRRNFFDNTQDLLNLKNLFVNPNEQKQNPLENFENLLAVFKSGISIGQDLMPEKQNESLIESLLKKFVMVTPSDKLLNAFSELNIKPETSQIQNNPEVKQIPKQEKIPMADKNLLVVSAKINANPEKLAKAFIDGLDELTLNTIVVFKDEPETIKKMLLEFTPDLIKYPEWLNKFVEKSIEYIKTLEEEPEPKSNEN